MLRERPIAEAHPRPRCVISQRPILGMHSLASESPATQPNRCRVRAQLWPWHGAQDGLERLHVAQCPRVTPALSGCQLWTYADFSDRGAHDEDRQRSIRQDREDDAEKVQGIAAHDVALGRSLSFSLFMQDGVAISAPAALSRRRRRSEMARSPPRKAGCGASAAPRVERLPPPVHVRSKWHYSR